MLGTTGRNGTAADSVREALAEAGFVLVERPVPGDVISPVAAARLVASADLAASAAIPYDAPGSAEAVNAAWHNLAHRTGIIGRERDFLVSVQLADSPTSEWLRARCDGTADLTSLGPLHGRPELITLSLDGEHLLAATCEEHDVWLVAIDEPAQHPTARRFDGQRPTAADSKRYHEGLRRLRSLGPVRRAHLHGLAANPSTSTDILLRVLKFPADLKLWDFLLYRELTDDLIAAALAHPDRRVRNSVVENANLTPAQRLTFLVDPDERVRLVGAVLAADHRLEVPETILLALSAETHLRIRQEAAHLPTNSSKIATLRAHDPSPHIRRIAADRDWRLLTDSERAGLLGDEDPAVRGAARLADLDGAPVDSGVFTILSEAQQRQVATTVPLAQDLVDLLASGTSRHRAWLAANPHTPLRLLLELASDEDADVRLAVSIRPELTEQQRAAIPVVIDPRGHYTALAWVRARHADLQAMARLARSAHLLIRRSVATVKELPTETAELLARDEDFAVRLLLAENCRQAPADLLLRTWLEWTGYSRHKILKHPNFPLHGQARHINDPEPDRRYLALHDPDLSERQLDELSRDSDPRNRRAALADPRLSAPRIAQLADDSDSAVRAAAAAHPGLPPETLRTLLDRQDTAKAAASNPALTHEDMLELIEQAYAAG